MSQNAKSQGREDHGVVSIDLPYVPRSVNRTRGEHWALTRRSRIALKHDLRILLLAERYQTRDDEGVYATATLFFQVNRRRDEGNFRAELEKALGDVLTEGGWIPDDTPEHFRFGRIDFAVDKTRPPHTKIQLGRIR